ncbi:MAG: hypothetical protein ACLGI3_06700, partial [Actinomycetes bacterium]
MADIAFDADALRQDRQRYAGLLEQAEQEIAAWESRSERLRQVIAALDELIAAGASGGGSGDQPAAGGAEPTGDPADAEPVASLEVDEAPAVADGEAGGPAVAPAPAVGHPAPPPATATPAAPEPVEPPAASAGEAPRGTDAIRLVLASDPGRSWTLADLLAALGSRGWFPTSRRPEEGVRISLKRLADRGGAVRTDDGRWRLPDGAQAVATPGNGAAQAPEEQPPPATAPAPPPARPARPTP